MIRSFFALMIRILWLAAFLCNSPGIVGQTRERDTIRKVVNDALDFSVQQTLGMAKSLQNMPGLLPKNADRFGNLETCRPDWWTRGFFPGILWYLYEYSGNEELKKWAQEFTLRG